MKRHLSNTLIMSALSHGDKGISTVRQLTKALNGIKDFHINNEIVEEVVRCKGAGGRLMFDIAYLLGITGYYPEGYILKKECVHVDDIKPKRKKSSQYTGVSWMKDRGRWAAQIRINYKTKTIGIFKCEHDAAKARNVEAEKFGRKLNIIEEA